MSHLSLQDYYNIRKFLVKSLDASKDPNAYNYLSYIIGLLLDQLSIDDHRQHLTDITNESKSKRN